MDEIELLWVHWCVQLTIDGFGIMGMPSIRSERSHSNACMCPPGTERSGRDTEDSCVSTCLLMGSGMSSVRVLCRLRTAGRV